MKTICWVTSEYLLQVDMPVIAELNKIYDITWVLLSKKNSDKIKTAEQYAKTNFLKMSVFELTRNRFSPMNYFEYARLCKKICAFNSDVYYFDFITFPFALFAIKKYIAPEKVIMAMHHGSIHKSMEFRHLYKLFLSYLCKQKFRFQYFSNVQASYYTGEKKNLYVIPLALNDYGEGKVCKNSGCVNFLFFGLIIETKNVDLLINAACKLKERIKLPFKVSIVGKCNEWDEKYSKLIKYPEVFDLDIRMVPDSMIPDLFTSAHYLVLPYKAVTQSGPLRIAYGYNLPVIASDLDGFKECVVDGVTGFLFKNDDEDSLCDIMQYVVEHADCYNSIQEAQSLYVKENYSIDVIVGQYKEMIDSII